MRPEVRLEPDDAGRAQLAVSFPSARSEKDVSRLAQEVFALPGRIAEARKRKLAIALDEFQAINAFNGGSVEHALRAAVQHQRQVGYVFSGSEPALMERMLGKSRPFYKAGPVMRLQKIPEDRFADFLEARFRATGIKPVADFGSAIVELAGNLPYDVQRLAHEVWDDARAAGRKTVNLDDLHATLTRLLGEHETLFEGPVAAAHAGAARRAARGGAPGRPRAALVRNADPPSAYRRIHRAGVARRAGARRHPHQGGPALRRRRFAAARVGREENFLMKNMLDRIGLGRPDLRAWAMYDWANSAYQTTIIAAVFPVYYTRVAGERAREGRRDCAPRPGRPRSRSSSSRSSRRSSAPLPTTRRSRSACSASSWASASRRASRCSGSPMATGCSR